ncbi:MAG: VCBS repeat-containing protein [Rhodopirellula sp.]|nr:VCBS repeat-containing protein [Rhodopirellula sp.]
MEDYALTIDPPAASLGTFTGPHTVSNGENRPDNIFAADIDGDGDLDIAASNSVGDSVVWLMNDGAGGFTRKVIDGSPDGASGVRVADLNGDGHLDVTANSFKGDRIYWYENDGNENFTKHLISDVIDGPVATVAVDIDGDGDFDLASTGYFNDRVTLFMNDGGGLFTPRTLSTSFDKAFSLDASDLDSDGDIDLVVGPVNSDTPGIRWFENDGAGGFTEQPLIASPQKAQTIRSSDLDGDGDRDLIIAFFNDIAWFENDGNETFTKHVISTTAAERKTEIADVDGDGDLDLLVTSSDNDKLLLFKNDGFQNFSETLIAEDKGFWFVTAGDIDSDGDLDAITGTVGNSILWYENVGATLSGVKFEDVDGDGFQDAGEPSLAGWTIKLTGQNTSGETVNLTTTTTSDDPGTPEDETGRYIFSDVSPGTYTVSEVVQPGWTLSSPTSAYQLTIFSDGRVQRTEGENDNFGPGFEPGTLNRRHTGQLASATFNNFDDIPGVTAPADARVGATFYGLPSDIVSATLTMRVRAGANGGQPGNASPAEDQLRIGFAEDEGRQVYWQRRFGGSGDGGAPIPIDTYPFDESDPANFRRRFSPGFLQSSWGTNAEQEFTLDLAALPLEGGGTTSVIDQLITRGYLDVWMSDDTGVDYMTLEYQTSGDIDRLDFGNVVVDSPLLAHYEFDGDASDSSEYGRNAVVTGAQLTTDRFGTPDSAYLFDGVDDYIQAMNIGLPEGNSSRTMSAWVKFDSFAENPVLLAYGSNITDQQSGVRVVRDKWQLSFWDNDLNTTTTPPVNEWVHVAMVFDQSTSIASVYQNGVLVGSGEFAPNTVLSGNGLLIGRNSELQNSSLFYLDGALDDVRVYGEALSAEQIRTVAGLSTAVVNITPADAEGAEGDAGEAQFTFTVTREGSTDAPASVHYAVAGAAVIEGIGSAAPDDFVGGIYPSGIVEFAAGQATVQIPIPVQGDGEAELDDLFEVTLSSPSAGLTLGTASALGTIQNDDSVNGLTVTSVTPTATGVVVVFSEAVELSSLNLNGSSAPDLVLAGDNLGTVAGSLVLSSDGTTATFVKTGGPLEPDTYALTLRSATDGWKSADGGRLLDSYLPATFTVFVPGDETVTVSLPDVVRGYSQSLDIPAAGTGIPLTISRGTGVTGLDLTLVYDHDLLNVTSFTSAVPGASAVFNPANGLLTISKSSEFTDQAGALVVGYFTATVPETAEYKAKQILDISSLAVYDDAENPGELPAIDDDGVHIAAFFGDANGSRTYNSPDTTLTQRLISQINDGLPAYPLADPTLITDITLNGRLQANDTTSIQRVITQIPVANVPELPVGITPPAASGADPQISIPRNLSGAVGDTVTVPVNLEVTEPGGITISGTDIALSYDATKFLISNVTLGNLLPGFSQVPNTSTAGTLFYTASSATGTSNLAQGTIGTLFTVDFTVLAGATPGESAINLRASSGGTFTAVFDNDLEELVLSPAPTNGDADLVDGLFIIAGGDVNEAPTAVSLQNTVTTLAEDASTASRRKIADIVVTDDALGTNALSLSGADAGLFELDGTELFLSAGVSLDFETNPTLDVTVSVDDVTVGSTPDASVAHTVTITPADSGNVIGIADALVSPGDTHTLVVTLDEAAGMTAFDLWFSYDTSLFAVTSIRIGNDALEFTPTANVNDAAGTVFISAFGTNPLSAGSKAILEIDVAVSESAPLGTTSVFQFVSASLNEGGIPVSPRSATLTIDIPTFRVTSTEVREGAVALQLSRELDESVLNLFAGQNTPNALPDAVLTDGSGSTVTGSLVYDAATKSITFVKTGGAFAAGNYTLTLSSRSDGFIDASGELLDGDSDGTAGGDFQTSFTVDSTTDRTLSIKDFARGPRQAVELGTEAGIPVSIDNGDGVQSVDFTVSYDAETLTPSAVNLASGMPAGWQVTANLNTPGVITVSVFGASALPAGTRNLVVIAGQVKDSATYGDSSLLSVSSVSSNDGAIVVRGDDAVQTVAFLGDASGNQGYSGFDASKIARVAVGLDSGFDAYPTIDPVIIGDASGNGGLSGFDASKVARKAVGLPEPSIPDIPVVVAARPASPVEKPLPLTVMPLVSGENTKPDALIMQNKLDATESSNSGQTNMQRDAAADVIDDVFSLTPELVSDI